MHKASIEIHYCEKCPFSTKWAESLKKHSQTVHKKVKRETEDNNVFGGSTKDLMTQLLGSDFSTFFDKDVMTFDDL